MDVDTAGSAHSGSHHSGRSASGILYPVASGDLGSARRGTAYGSGGGGSADNSSGGAIPVEIQAEVRAQPDPAPGGDDAPAGPSNSNSSDVAPAPERVRSSSSGGRTPNFFVGLRRSMGRNLLCELCPLHTDIFTFCQPGMLDASARHSHGAGRSALALALANVCKNWGSLMQHCVREVALMCDADDARSVKCMVWTLTQCACAPADGEPAEYWDSNPIEAAAARPTPARRSMRRQQSRIGLPAPLHEFVADGGEGEDSSAGGPAAADSPATSGGMVVLSTLHMALDPNVQTAPTAAAQALEPAGADSLEAAAPAAVTGEDAIPGGPSVSPAGGSGKPGGDDTSMATAVVSAVPSGSVRGELRRHFGSQDGTGTK